MGGGSLLTRVYGLLTAQILVAGALAAAAACGGGGGATAPGTTSGSPGPSGATITIANGRVSPADVTIAGTPWEVMATLLGAP